MRVEKCHLSPCAVYILAILAGRDFPKTRLKNEFCLLCQFCQRGALAGNCATTKTKKIKTRTIIIVRLSGGLEGREKEGIV